MIYDRKIYAEMNLNQKIELKAQLHKSRWFNTMLNQQTFQLATLVEINPVFTDRIEDIVNDISDSQITVYRRSSYGGWIPDTTLTIDEVEDFDFFNEDTYYCMCLIQTSNQWVYYPLMVEAVKKLLPPSVDKECA